MLDTMRKQGRSLVLKVLFGIIAFVFVFSFVGSNMDRVEVAATVNDQVITRREVDRAYMSLVNMYRQFNADMVPPDAALREQALGQLVSTELLAQEAQRLGLEVDSGELRDSIASMQQFQPEGRFDRDAYVQVLQMNGLKPSDFEKLQQRQLLVDKVQDVVRSGVHVGDQELRDRFAFENERLTLRYVRLPAARFTEQVTVSDADVQAHYDAHAERYREPERVAIQMVEFRAEDFAAQITPSDADVQAAYEANLDQYKRPEEVQARHILFRVDPTASDEEKAKARASAEAVLARAKAGEDFAALATAHSQDSTATNGGDLGSFGRGVMTPAFEAAAFALEAGGLSEIVETPFGLHLIKVEGRTPERTQPLDEVRAAIVASLQTQQARNKALDAVQTAHEQALDGESLEALARAHGLSVQTPPPFAAGTFRAPIAAEAFLTEVGEVGEIVSEASGYTILTVVERLPSRVPPLDEVRERVVADVTEEKALALANERAEALRAGLATLADLEALATAETLEVEEIANVTRLGAHVGGLGAQPALKTAAFGLAAEATILPAVYPAGDAVVIAAVSARQAPDATLFDGEKATLENRLQTQAENAALKTFLDQLKGRARIEYGQGFAAPTAS